MASDSDSSLPPNKRLKTQTLSLDLASHSAGSSKGKHKLEEPEDDPKDQEGEDESMDSDSNQCGICLSEEGKAIRGWINSCDHYFCFVCIMEWAKVESRCPMCKRRFSSIRRPAKEGVFACERVVDVPVRDQVYHPLGNTTVGPFDPYAQVQCSVCHGMADESLLLLCDLCDSAAHTYCVGLGATVPEGDWFCHDCAVSRVEHASGDIDTDRDNQYSFRNIFIRPPAEAHVSIFDIVRESNIVEVEGPHLVESSHTNQLLSPIPIAEISIADNVTEVGTNMSQNVADKITESGARTLHRCRNVHNHIRALRENWSALQTGFLSFSFGSVDSGGKGSQNCNAGAVPGNRSGQTHSSSSSSVNCQQLTAQDGFSSGTSYNRGSKDIDKAWKMMDIAKSVQKSHERTIIAHQASKQQFSKRNAPKGVTNTNSSPFVSKSLALETKRLGSNGSERHYNYDFHEKICKDNGSQKSENYRESRFVPRGTYKFNEVSPTTHMHRYFESPSSMKVQTSVPVDVCHKNGGKLLQKNLHEASSNVIIERSETACLFSRFGTVPGTSEFFHSKHDLPTSSSCEAGLQRGQCGMEECHAKYKPRKSDDAKSEIQSLVKLNLKLLSRDKQLGADAFKEVARLATHTILAACGLEHPKPGVYSFPSSVCCHTEQIQQRRKSTLMPTSCRECFYAFVKDVVNTIMLKTVDCAESC